MTTSTTTKHDRCVVYRTGDIENFAWYRSEAMPTNQAAELRAEMEQVGHKAMVANYAQSVTIGLPETYE